MHARRPLLFTLAVLAIIAASTSIVRSQSSRSFRTDPNQGTRPQRFRHTGTIQKEDNANATGGWRSTRLPAVSEAPTGFDNQTNGFTPQGPAFDTIDEDTVQPRRSFNDNRFVFEAVETIADGLGPVYNAQSCRECHQNVVTGGASQVAEHRTGRLEADQFYESLGGSLIQSRARSTKAPPRGPVTTDVRAGEKVFSDAYERLTTTQQNQMLAFLDSL